MSLLGMGFFFLNNKIKEIYIIFQFFCRITFYPLVKQPPMESLSSFKMCLVTIRAFMFALLTIKWEVLPALRLTSKFSVSFPISKR